MRRIICAALVVASSIGFYLIPAGADSSTPAKVKLAFDYSDNSVPASASSGTFNINVDVLPEHTPGVVRIVASSPDGLSSGDLVCAYQDVVQSEVDCSFNFTSSGVWSIRAQFAPFKSDSVSAVATTNLRVGD
jgi:hypothetical protein